MIHFLTLFLGLTVGPQAVELQVDPAVAAVELYLDGEEVARVDGPPWHAAVDLGWELAPRRLEAVALDEEGRELDRTEQTLNLPRPPAEVSLYFDTPPGTGGSPPAAGDAAPRRVRLAWQSVLGSTPTAVRMELDGEPLPGATLAGVELPPLDPDTVHFLRVELDFPDNLSAAEELVFGGGVQEEISTQLTAVPVIAAGRLPDAEGLEGWLRADGGAGEPRPLQVRAVEAGGVDLVVVADDGAQGILERLLLDWRSQGSVRLGVRTDPQAMDNEIQRAYKLLPEQQMRMLWPRPTTHPGGGRQRFDVFLTSAPFTRQDGGLLWLMTRLRPNMELPPTTQLAEAVAVAGNQAAARDRRRAVVLLWNGGLRDAGQLAPLTVRRYLERLRVPLFVWSLGEDLPDGGWGEVTDTSTLDKLDRALRRLRRHLEDQRILWVDGRHLPQRIEPTPRARKLTLARTPVPETAPSPPPRDPPSPPPETPVGNPPTGGAPEPAGPSRQPALESLDLPELAGPSLSDLGRPASEGAAARRTLFLEGGTPLRAAPAGDAPRLAVVDAGVEVPVVETRETAERSWWRVTWNGRSGWVPVGATGAVETAVGSAASPGVAPPSPVLTVEDRLERAERWLSRRGSLGPWQLWTDVQDDELMARLESLAGQLPGVWRQRTGLGAPTDGDGGAVLLFAREEDYQAFARGEDPTVVELELAGHAGGGLAALAVEREQQREWRDVAALLVHELVHLLSDRAFPDGLPPWLQEGLADELAYSRIDNDGRLVPGTLGGESAVQVESSRLTPGQVRVERREEISGARASLARLHQAMVAGTGPGLQELLDASWEDFVATEGLGLRYVASAFLVRFLQEEHGAAFRGFLQAVAAGGPADRARLGQYLAASGAVKQSTVSGLQRAFQAWLRAEAARAGLL